MYSELVEHNVKNRDRIVHVSDLGYFNKERNYDAYASAFQFDKSVLEYVKIAGGIKGFGEEAGTGKVYAEIMWMDIDNKNLIEAQTTAQQLVANLNKKYEVYADDLMIFFSGNKGFHIGIHNKLFDKLIFNGGYDLHDRIKMMAIEIAGDLVIDTRIYNKNRIFRIPNSMNMKSGLYKIPISYEELCGSIVDIKTLAKNPRLEWTYKVTNLSPVTKLVERWQSISIQESTYVREEINGGFFSVPQEGDRDNAFFRQSCMFLDHGLDIGAVTDIMEVYRNSANVGSKDPIKPNDLARILGSAMSKTAKNIKKNVQDKIQAQDEPKVKSRVEMGTVDDYINSYHNYLNDDSARIWLNNSVEDNIFKGRLRGKVGAIIGYGGAKKSLRALQILLYNIKKYNIKGLYSSMEQSIFELMSRIINYSVEVSVEDGNIHRLPTAEYLDEEEELRKQAREILKAQIAPIYGKNLWMTPTTGFVVEEYDQLLTDLNEREGLMDILVIDGLSRMGGPGSEVERTVVAAREIKDLAQKWNIFIIPMVHVSRGLKLHTRDVRELIRGGEKIVDEFDFTITMSQIIDGPRSTPDKIEYRKDVCWERVYDKRGKGITADIINKFNKQTLELTPMNVEPNDFEVIIKKGGKEDF